MIYNREQDIESETGSKRRAVRLGEVLGELMQGEVVPRQERFGAAAELWERILPQELCQHCEIADLAGGRLKVKVDSPSYMQELQLCSSELIKQFAKHCPRAQIREIKFVYA